MEEYTSEAEKRKKRMEQADYYAKYAAKNPSKTGDIQGAFQRQYGSPYSEEFAKKAKSYYEQDAREQRQSREEIKENMEDQINPGGQKPPKVTPRGSDPGLKERLKERIGVTEDVSLGQRAKQLLYRKVLPTRVEEQEAYDMELKRLQGKTILEKARGELTAEQVKRQLEMRRLKQPQIRPGTFNSSKIPAVPMKANTSPIRLFTNAQGESRTPFTWGGGGQRQLERATQVAAIEKAKTEAAEARVERQVLSGESEKPTLGTAHGLFNWGGSKIGMGGGMGGIKISFNKQGQRGQPSMADKLNNATGLFKMKQGMGQGGVGFFRRQEQPVTGKVRLYGVPYKLRNQNKEVLK